MSRAMLVVLVMQISFIRAAPGQDSLPDSLVRPARLSGRTLEQLPVDDARHAFVLIPGVRLTGLDLGLTLFPAISIRGSTTARSNVYVDGAPLRFETRGGAGVGLAAVSIDNVAVLTGLAPVWMGDAANGAIAYETRAGASRLEAGARLSGDLGTSASAGYGRADVSVGGPLAGHGALTFMIALSGQQQRSSYRGPGASSVPSYLPAGVDTLADTGSAQVAVPLWEVANDGLRRPMDWSTARNEHLKLQYRYGNSGRASLTMVGGAFEQRAFPGQTALDPPLYVGQRLQTNALILGWQHPIGAWRGGSLNTDLNLSLVIHRDTRGPLDSAAELETRDATFLGRGLRFAGADILSLPAGDQLVRDLRTNSGTRGVPFFGTRPDVVQSYRTNPYGLAQDWPTSGYGGTLSDAQEQRWQGRATLNWRRAAQQVAVGIEIQRAHVSSYASDVVRQIGTDIFTADPRRLAGLAEARLSWSGAIVDLGLRYDRISPGGVHPLVPSFISSSGSAYWNPSGATDDTAYANSVARTFTSDRTQSVFSPRLGFTYPIAARTEVRLAYSRTVEPLAWGAFFGRSNSDLSFTDVRDLFGRDIDFATVGLVEAGVGFALGRTAFDVAAYRKDAPKYVGRFTPFSDPKDSSSIVAINVVTLIDDSHTQGIDLGVRWQHGWVTAAGAYGLAHTTGSEGAAINQSPVTTHSAAIAASLQVPWDLSGGGVLKMLARGLNATVLARLQSGENYTLVQNTGSGVIAPGPRFNLPVEPFDASQLPSFKRLDLRIAKTMRVGGHDWSLYIDARNILDLSNLTSVFAETGDTTNPFHQAATIGDPAVGTGEFGILRDEALNAGALQPDNTTVNLNTCATWQSQANCVALMRTEQRFGDGDHVFTLAEQQVAFNAYYRDFYGSWRFFAPGRTLRVGFEFRL